MSTINQNFNQERLNWNDLNYLPINFYWNEDTNTLYLKPFAYPLAIYIFTLIKPKRTEPNQTKILDLVQFSFQQSISHFKI